MPRAQGRGGLLPLRPFSGPRRASDFPERLAGEFLRMRVRLPSHLERQDEEDARADPLLDEFGPNVWSPWRDVLAAGGGREHSSLGLVTPEGQEKAEELVARLEEEGEKEQVSLPEYGTNVDEEEGGGGGGGLTGKTVLKDFLSREETPLPVGDPARLFPPFVFLPLEVERCVSRFEGELDEDVGKALDWRCYLRRLRPFRARPISFDVKLDPPSMPDLTEREEGGEGSPLDDSWPALTPLDASKTWAKVEEQVAQETRRLREEQKRRRAEHERMVRGLLREELPARVTDMAQAIAVRRVRKMEAEENRAQVRRILDRHRRKPERAKSDLAISGGSPNKEKKSSIKPKRMMTSKLVNLD